MITDKDIKKLKEVFITKDDAKVFLTKDDAKAFATKEDLEKTNKSISILSEDIITVIEMVGETNQNLKEISQKLDKKTTEHDDLLEHHERQIDRLNDKVFPAT